MVHGDVQLPVIAVRPMEGRTGTTLLMQLLATSPEIVFDDRYPSEYRFLSYFRRLAELATEPFDEHRHRGVTAFFFGDVLEFGPVPFRSDVIDTRELRDPLVGGMWGACSTLIRQQHPNVRYYAEKLAVPVDDDLRRAVPLRVIDLVRDPRDVLCSIRGFTASGQGEDGFGAADETATLAYVSRFADRTKSQLDVMLQDRDSETRQLVRYEDMIADLDGIAHRLGTWLDVTLDGDAVIANRDHYRHHMSSPSIESSVSRWRKELTSTESELLADRLGDHLRQLGYETT